MDRDNQAVVVICGEEYKLLAQEPEDYIQKVGAYVNKEMEQVMSSGRVGRVDAAVLTAVNIADALFKAQSAAAEALSKEKAAAAETLSREKAAAAEALSKERTTATELRGQIRQYLDEAGKSAKEASELKREVFRLQQQLEKAKK